MIEVRASQATCTGIETERGLAFLGVPYARPPVGSMRFRAPQPLPRGGQVDATRAGASPPQVEGPHAAWMPPRNPQTHGEDCLNLNLGTPSADSAGRPVIVHVFGGGFQGGSATGGHIDEAAFAHANDVVLVRPNMRTGALGFLHLAEAFPALDQTNRGLLDLIAALDWVHENVSDFGGDPDNVTLVGLSSGAFTVAALYAASSARGLFARAWMMSGSASRIITSETAARVAADFLDRVGVAPGDIHALERIHVQRILDVQGQVLASDLGERNAPGGRTLGIVHDGTSLPRHPLDALADGDGPPMVLSFTRHEARMWYAAGVMGEADAARLRRTVERFHPGRADEVLAELSRAHPHATPTEREEAFLSDRIYRTPARRTAEAQRAAGRASWTYEFAWSPALPHVALGASHGFDEPFVFGLHDPQRVPIAVGSPDAAVLGRTMEQALVSFARRGDPGWSGERIFL